MISFLGFQLKTNWQLVDWPKSLIYYSSLFHISDVGSSLQYKLKQEISVTSEINKDLWGHFKNNYVVMCFGRDKCVFQLCLSLYLPTWIPLISLIDILISLDSRTQSLSVNENYI